MLNIISSAAGSAAMVIGILSVITGIKTLSGIYDASDIFDPDTRLLSTFLHEI
ncbi:MAG: hypothetical protein KDF60_17990 [Calditrichaeota bacterium]|nr:hypothetical protein [Calditrichota bacterium]